VSDYAEEEYEMRIVIGKVTLFLLLLTFAFLGFNMAASSEEII
jgi:hypothetical protein